MNNKKHITNEEVVEWFRGERLHLAIRSSNTPTDRAVIILRSLRSQLYGVIFF